MTRDDDGITAVIVEELKTIKNLSEVAPAYKALLCDAWGVIHNGVALFDGVEEALVRFRELHGPVIILTNAPRPSDIIPPQLDRLGLSREAYDGVVTSGDAIRSEIAQRVPEPMYRLGPDKDDTLYQGLDIDWVPVSQARYIVCTGLFDEIGETPESYREMLGGAADRNVEMICANPDIVVRWGDKLLYCAGALAELYETLGGRVIHGGKPHSAIYNLAMQKIHSITQGLSKREVLAIGDGLSTDIKGANAHDIDALYVFGAGGIHDKTGGSPGKILEDVGVSAIAAMEQVQW